MADIALIAEPSNRARFVQPSRRLRTDGRVPAVIYGHGEDPVAVTVDARDLRTALASLSGGSVLFNLNVAGDEHLVIAREVQRHPVRHTVAHVDFQVVSRDEVVPADDADPPRRRHPEGDPRRRHGRARAAVAPSSAPSPRTSPPRSRWTSTASRSGRRSESLTWCLPSGVTVDLDGDTPVVVAAAPHAASTADEEAAEAAAGRGWRRGGLRLRRSADAGESSSES